MKRSKSSSQCFRYKIKQKNFTILSEVQEDLIVFLNKHRQESNLQSEEAKSVKNNNRTLFPKSLKINKNLIMMNKIFH